MFIRLRLTTLVIVILLNQSRFLYLTTKGWKTGKEHRIEIWYVDDNDNYYVMSEHLKRVGWRFNCRDNPKLVLVVLKSNQV